MSDLRAGQAAERLGVSRRTVLNWVKDGKLAARESIGGHARIPEENVERVSSLPGRKVRWLSSGKASHLLGVTPKTLHKWARAGNIPFGQTLGGHMRFAEHDIRALAEELGLA